MLDNSLPDNGAGHAEQMRAATRVNLFMAATLIASGVETAVKIRDLSAAGAQVEGAELPEVGSPMTLTRGRLSIHGHVAWRAERRCGLKFSANISVKDWMANPANREQGRVDHIVTSVKAGAVPLVSGPTPATPPSDGVADDLARLARLLETLGDALASDPAIIAQHGISLQSLDIAVQTLTTLAETMRTGGAAGAAQIIRLNELRTSCSEALRGAG